MSNPPHKLRFRQIHLDFHTSGDIPGVGAKFEKKHFQNMLRLAHANSVTLFSKCHHGWSYHPTEVGRTHPHLQRDLLGEQIEACREIDVRCPIYISAGFDEVAAAAHRDWIVVDKTGSTGAPLTNPGYKTLRFNSGYLDYLCAQIEEVVQRWPDNDGIFLDIISARRDYHPSTLQEMRAAGLDPASDADMDAYGQQVLLRYYERTTAAAKSVREDTPIFHNGGHIPVGAHKLNFFNSHFELESLPTGGWGYDHFPFSARYAITQPRDFLGMTGKFHNTWGEFGGFKRPAALRYECAGMIAQGAKCSVGDQLHPSGEMNPDTCALLGEAYAEIAAKEPWANGVQAAARIAIVSSEKNQEKARGHGAACDADEGISRMLLELHLPFVVLDAAAPWEGIDVVILAETFQFTPETLQRATRFLSNGGRIVAAGAALLDEHHKRFVLDPGAVLTGRSAFDPDYLFATELTPGVPVRSAIVIEGGAWEIQPGTAQVLAERREPYFNRTWEHFCSHQHAPDAPETASPAAILGNGIAWFAHDLFSQYRKRGQPLYRDFFRDALLALLPGGLPVETNLPTVARFNLLEQPAENRFVAHLLYAPITLRAQTNIWGQLRTTEIIEELLPLLDNKITVQLPRPVQTVRLVPANVEIPFTMDSDRLTFTVPAFTGHQMVTLEY